MDWNIVDAHQHFWDPELFAYPWMSPSVQPLVRPFLPQDLKPLLDASRVGRTVVVQATSSAEEASWLLHLANETGFIAGVVTWCDLQSPRLGNVLDELQRHPKFKGVRHQIENEPDDGWMLRPDVILGFKELERRNIAYDMLVRPRHLKHLTHVREHCPNLRMVVDHIAKPQIATRMFEPWAHDIERVAQLPGVWCKLSGMSTEADWKSWSADDLRPYVQHVTEVFGLGRVMFGSDWPVCLLAGSHRETMTALKNALKPLSPEEERMVWSENAVSFYGLDAGSPRVMAH